MSNRLFNLKTNEIYGWFTGCDALNHQILMGIDWNAEVCIQFNGDGDLLSVVERPFDSNGQEVAQAVDESPLILTPEGTTRLNSRFQKWTQDKITNPCAILVSEFWVPNRFIGIEAMPAEYSDFLEDPESADEIDQVEMPTLIQDWIDENLFVFWWNEDYWMSPSGEVNSH